MGHLASKFHKFKKTASDDLAGILRDAFKVEGQAVQRVCIFCCEKAHETSYVKGIKEDGKLYAVQTNEWKDANSLTNWTYKTKLIDHEEMKDTVLRCMQLCRRVHARMVKCGEEPSRWAA